MQIHLFRTLTLAILVLAAPAGYADELRPVVEIKEKGTINWTTGVVEARGVGIPDTYTDYDNPQGPPPETVSEANIKAQHNLLETIVNIRINSENRVIDVIESYPSVMNQLKAMAYKAPEVESLRRYLADGTVETWSQISLRGALSQLILPPEVRQIEPIKQVVPRNSRSVWTSRKAFSEIYTGLVLDARGLEAVPVLAPRLLDENFEEVFGPAYASREFVVQSGMVHYTTDLWKAKFHLRVSDNPLIVKALKTLWPGRCDFIISNADAAKLKSASEHLVFLKECRVIIVLDPL